MFKAISKSEFNKYLASIYLYKCGCLSRRRIETENEIIEREWVWSHTCLGMRIYVAVSFAHLSFSFRYLSVLAKTKGEIEKI